jgi:hypothetical protein
MATTEEKEVILRRMRLKIAKRNVEEARSALRMAANALILTEDDGAHLASEMLLDLERQIGNVQNNEMPEAL